MELREYQKECIQTVNALPDGSRSVVCLATGLGKTVVAANFDFEGRVLWLSHRDELVRQPERYFRERGMSFGVEKAGEKAGDEDVVSASVQSLSRDRRLHSFEPDEFDTIIVDEAHHAAAPTYRKILDYFHPRKLIGLTATPKRGDNVRLTDVYQDICFVRDIRWGIRNGFLSPIQCMRVRADFDMKSIKKTAGDYSAADVSRIMKRSNDPLIVAKTYVELCEAGHRQTLIYCPTLAICNVVTDAIRKLLPDDRKETVQTLSEKTSAEDRASILARYQSHEVNCIVNCMILTEGTDLPETSAIINNRPSANSTLYQQIVGRGLRLAEGKDYCLVIDVVGKNARSKGICTAPTLFGQDPDRIPEKILKQMEGQDLLAACDDLACANVALARNMHLVKEMIDIFTQERISIITDNAFRGFTGIADAYAKKLETETKGYDFRDLIVEVTPFSKRKYRVKATFHGDVWFSEPDLLGQTTIEAEIPAEDLRSNKGYSFISPPMQMADAIEFVESFLRYIIPSHYSCVWSRSARESMKACPATEKQSWRIAKAYKEDNIWASSKKLNKLQASDLICLRQSIDDLEKQKKMIDHKEKDWNKNRMGIKLEKWMSEQQELADREERFEAEKKAAYEKQYKQIRDEIDEAVKKEKEQAKSIMSMADKEQSFSLPVTYAYFSMKKAPSDRQKGFIRQLEQKLIGDHYRFDISLSRMSVAMNSFQNGCVISYLLAVQNLAKPPENMTYSFQSERFLRDVREISYNKQPPSIRCYYRIVRTGGFAGFVNPLTGEKIAGSSIL